MEEIKMKMQEYVGTRDHNKMYNRDLAKQHPIKAIEGLDEKIAELEAYHVYLYNRIGELKQIMEQEKLSLQNITDAEQAAKLNILTTGETSVGSLTTKKEEALVQIRVAGENLLNGLDDKLTVAQEYVNAAQTSATDAETYAAQAEGYAEAAQVDVEAVRAEKVGYEDYATASKGGVIKESIDRKFAVTNDGLPFALICSSNDAYNSAGDDIFVSKGTLKTAILANNLVSQTNYATSEKGGVIKISSEHGVTLTTLGKIKGMTKTKTQYDANAGDMIISKGTLENVLADKLKDYVRKDEV